MATAWKGTTLDDLPLLNAIDGTVIKPYITKGTPVSGDDVKGVWLHLKSPRTGWMNSGANQTKVRWENVTVTPPSPLARR